MRVLQVSEFVDAVNIVMKEAWAGEEVGVEGEVSGYRVSQGQWVSFDLKDDKALVNVFLPLWNLRVPVEDGMRVRVIGIPRVYPKYGKFSLSAERIELAGEGALKKALAELRRRLAEEGLFDPSRKRDLPRFPARIALIASRESAAYGDFVRIVGERWGSLEIDLYHVLVQGDRAAQDIVSAFRTAQNGEYDVIVMTRGGGSFEELMAFNDEQVVRAVHASKIPTLVAIGHERDITLAEEAADVRGSTPTDCARRLVPDRRDVQYELATLVSAAESALTRQIEDGLATIEQMTSLCESGVRQWLRKLSERLQYNTRLLASLDPSAVLTRGYAIVADAKGHTLTSVKRLATGESVRVTLGDGAFTSHVEEVYGKNNGKKD